MSRLSGVLLIVSGVAVATYAMTWPDGPEVEAKPSAQNVAPEPVKPVEATKAIVPSDVASESRPQATVVTQPAPPPPTVSPQPAPAVVALPAAKPAPVKIEVAAPPAPKVVVEPKIVAGGPPLGREGLAREIQRQLKRVGCYAGSISGAWTPAVRRSMKSFTDRVNASLPVEQPDYILLAMVQGHQGVACGTQCPAGQSLANDGRCLPNSVVAASSKKLPPGAARRPDPGLQVAAKSTTPAATTNDSPVTTPEAAAPSPGRMSLAGPKQEPAQPHTTQRPGVQDKAEARPHRQSRHRQANNNRQRDYRPQNLNGLPSWVPWTRPWLIN